jgi:hypothetical protein
MAWIQMNDLLGHVLGGAVWASSITVHNSSSHSFRMAAPVPLMQARRDRIAFQVSRLAKSLLKS